jgi:hypothetical protein
LNGRGVDQTDTPRMRLELPTLYEARSFIGREQTIFDQPCDGVDGGFILFVRAGRVTTKGGVVGVDKIFFHRDDERVMGSVKHGWCLSVNTSH